MKTIALAALTSVALATPATAGVYANVEANSSRTGGNYESTTTDIHVGYEGGGITTLHPRRPEALPPKSGPMPQGGGLSSMFNRAREW